MVKEWCAIIPARGGSKRIPLKNILPFFDRPMIEWTIQAALKSQIFSDVIVSTDSQQIADIAHKAGAQIPFLRDTLADDQSTVSDVAHHGLTKLADQGSQYKNIAVLMPNCPNRTAQDIQLAVSNFEREKANFQISAVCYHWLNPWWAHRATKNNSYLPLLPEGMGKRSQDLERLLCPTGAIWLAKTEAFLQAKTFYGPGYTLFELPWTSAVDIDETEDVEFAEAARMVVDSNRAKLK